MKKGASWTYDLITICKLAETSKTYSYHSGSHNKIYY